MSPVIVHRKYRAGMVVLFHGRRWEIDGVEFWSTDEKLTLRALDDFGRVKTFEVWAREVEFTGDLVSDIVVEMAAVAGREVTA